MQDFVVRPMSRSDVAGAAALQRACFPPPFPAELLWGQEHLMRHLALFPQGQFIAVADGRVVGSASNCIVPEEAWLAHANWNDTVGGPFIEGHDREGTTLYGLDVSVHPDWRGLGVMRSLYAARFALVKSMSLTRYGTAVRIPGFQAFEVQNPGAQPEDYVREVVESRIVDRTLTPMLRVGLKPRGVIRNYMEDLESHHSAAVLEWRP